MFIMAFGARKKLETTQIFINMLNKIWNMHTMGFYAAVNRKSLFLYGTRQRSLRHTVSEGKSPGIQTNSAVVTLSTWEGREHGLRSGGQRRL